MNGNDILEFKEKFVDRIDEAWNKKNNFDANREVTEQERDSIEYNEFVLTCYDSEMGSMYTEEIMGF